MQDLKEWVGTRLGPYRLEVTKERAELLATAVCGRLRDGQSVPPTYLTIARDGEFEFLERAELPLKSILHGEQIYEYTTPIRIGESLEYETTVTDVYEKKGGSARMTFFILESVFSSGGQEVAKSRTNFIFRHLKEDSGV